MQRVAGGALTWMGEPRRALEVMTAAAARARQHDPVRTAEILAEAIAPAIMQGEIHLVRDLAQQVEEIWEDSADAAAAAYAHCLGHGGRRLLSIRRYRPGRPLPAPRNRLPIVLQHDGELQGAAFHAQSLGWSERYSEARDHLTTLMQAARRLASPTILAFALGYLR